MTGDLEARVITLERALGRLRPRIKSVRQLAEINDQTLGRFRCYGGGIAPVGGVTDFPAVCATIPVTLTVVDTYYGNCDITYDSASKSWIGCKMVSYPGTSHCPAVSSPITYVLVGSNTTHTWPLNVKWVGVSNGSGYICPSSAASCSTQTNGTDPMTATMQCTGTTTWRFGGASIAGDIYPVNTSVTLTITIP